MMSERVVRHSSNKCEGRACIGGHCQRCCYPPIRPDSPMRGGGDEINNSFARAADNNHYAEFGNRSAVAESHAYGAPQ